MSDISINATFGPEYQVNLVSPSDAITLNGTGVFNEPFTLNIGSGYNAGSITSSGLVEIKITASEAISAYYAVSYSGTVVEPTVADLSQYAGINRTAIVDTEVVNVVRVGLLTDVGWSWTPDTPVYVGVGGALTQTPPQTVRRIGYAIAPTKLILDPYPIVETV